jgi:hypothetical protein
MLEMNFTSTMGRSTVVLWNVPISAREMFENGIRLAGEPYAHLDGIRRGALMIFDDGQMRLFCGWEDIERRLEVLKSQSELDLDELGEDALAPHERQKLVKFIAENNHLFETFDRHRVRLRAWPNDLRAEGWRQGIGWLNEVINREAQKGGIHRRPKRKYFRLPSTGFLVKDFYQFRGLLSNHENCAKISWLVAQVINALSKGSLQTNRSITVITVSRSTMPLINHLEDNYFKTSVQLFRSVAKGSVDELEAIGEEVEGPAILITDVISSGNLGARIARTLSKVEWLGIIALLDTRPEDSASNIPSDMTLDYGINVLKAESIESIPVLALAWRKVVKLPPTTHDAESSEAIDEINVSPVEPFESLPDTDQNFWDYVKHKPEALLVGHYYGAYHHYIYKVDVGKLLKAANPDRDGETLETFLVDAAIHDLNELRYDPDKTVIIHPPRESSHAETVAKLVQEMTGALYRHVLYKDKFAGHWRFSPFVRHGVPLENNTLVLIDDGTNTGETLMGLLDVAAAGHPANVLAYVGITRMMPHKNSFFHNVKGIENVKGSVLVRFALGLSIPVYEPKNCPVCKLHTELIRTQEYCPLLSRYAKQLRDASLGESNDALDVRRMAFYLWRFHSELSVTKLREALETRDYYAPSYEHVNRILQDVTETASDEASQSLLDLAFVVCVEPEIAGATLLVHYLVKLIDSAQREIKTKDEDYLLTYVGFIFQLTVQLRQRFSLEKQKGEDTSPWESLFDRHRVSIQSLSQILTFVVSEGLTGLGDDESTRTTLSLEWLQRLGEIIRKPTYADAGPAKAVASIHLREAIPSLRGAKFSSNRGFMAEDARALYNLADETAHEFWWHSSNTMKGYIDSVIDELAEVRQPVNAMLWGSISPMFQALGNLCELQQELREIESLSRRTLGEHPGGDLFWSAGPLTDALIEFIQKFVQIGETIENRGSQMSKRVLVEESIIIRKKWKELYDLLNPAFGSIFPEVYTVAYSTWGQFEAISELPRSVGTLAVKVVSPLSDDARGFIPQILLRRFLTIAIQNLRTAAFSGWTSTQVESEGEAYVEIISDVIEGSEAICIRVIDNGRLHPSKPDTSGHRTGLSDIEHMARFYNAQLTRPTELDEDRTVVELKILQRLNRIVEGIEMTVGRGDDANGT